MYHIKRAENARGGRGGEVRGMVYCKLARRSLYNQLSHQPVDHLIHESIEARIRVLYLGLITERESSI